MDGHPYYVYVPFALPVRLCGTKAIWPVLPFVVLSIAIFPLNVSWPFWASVKRREISFLCENILEKVCLMKKIRKMSFCIWRLTVVTGDCCPSGITHNRKDWLADLLTRYADVDHFICIWGEGYLWWSVLQFSGNLLFLGCPHYRYHYYYYSTSCCWTIITN